MIKEQRYEFKKDLLQIHKRNRRDFSLKPEENEFTVPEGLAIVLPECYDSVVETAAWDFADYMLKSMEQSAMVTKKASEAPSLKLSYNENLGEASGYMGYRITVSENGITLEGFDSAGIAQGLYFLEDLMNLRRAPFLEKKIIQKKALFSPRFAQSPFGMFEYNDECLSYMAHLGYDAIMLWIDGLNINHRGEYIDMYLLCERAERYGIKVYIQLYADHSAHPDDPGAEEFYDNLYGKIFKACPKIKGVELVGEANHFHSKDPDPRVGKAPLSANFEDNIPTGKVTPGFWPCCDYPQWISLIKKCICKYRPDADIVFCTYNWSWVSEEERLRLIEQLPTDITLLSAWDVCQQFEMGKAKGDTTDYSLRQTEASDYFASEARAAKKRGIKVYANTETAGLTWDFGVIPYEPMPYQWLKRFESIVKSHEEWGVSGLLECIHYGFYPSFISDLEKWAFFTHEENLTDILHRILKRDFGTECFDKVNEAMKKWSEAISHATASNEDQYGAFRIGPSYPLWVADPRTDIFGGYPENGRIPTENNAMYGNAIYNPAYTPDMGFNRNNSMPGIRLYEEMKEIEKMRDLLLEGIELLESIPNPNEKVERVLNIGKFMYRTSITGLNAKKLYVLSQQLNITADTTKMLDIIGNMEKLLLEEKENVENTIPIVQADSRIGWEPSMEYQGDEKCLRWKLRQLDYDLNHTLKKHRECSEL